MSAVSERKMRVDTERRDLDLLLDIKLSIGLGQC